MSERTEKSYFELQVKNPNLFVLEISKKSDVTT